MLRMPERSDAFEHGGEVPDHGAHVHLRAWGWGGELVGSDLRVEYSAMGDAVNTAARMEQTAAPGTVQVSQETKVLIDKLFEFEDLGGKTRLTVVQRGCERDPAIDSDSIRATWTRMFERLAEEIDVERARRILNAIRERLGERFRPQFELDYLERLLTTE